MFKRPFLCVAMAFSAGILSFSYGINLTFLLVTSLVAALWVFLCAKKYRFLFFTMIMVFLLGISAMKWADFRKENIIRRFENRELEITATITEFSSDGKAIATFGHDNTNHKIYLVPETATELYPGDIVSATVSFSRPYSSKVSVMDFATYLAAKKVYIYGYTSDMKVTGRQKSGIMGAVYSIRRYVDNIGEKAFSGDARALFNAMVLGDKRLISPELSASLQAAGLNHIAVVSGMHLSIMISVLMLLLGSIIGVGRRAKILLCIGAVAITLLTGAGISAVRACIMCIVCQGAFLTSRENDALSGLSVTVFVMLAINPFVIFDIGFVLSVLSILGILLFMKPLEERLLPGTGGIVGQTVCVSTSAQLTVLPATICLFGTASAYSTLANVMVTVFASLLVTMGMLFTVVAKIPIISGIVAFVVKLSAEAVMIVCEYAGRLPGSLANVQGTGWDFFIVWAFLLVLFGMKKKHRKYTMPVFLSFAIIFTTAFIYYSADRNKTKMHFIPYGKQTMTAVRYPTGPFVLLGCPEESDARLFAESYGRPSYTYTVITRKNELTDAVKLASGGASGKVIVCSELLSYDKKQALAKEFRAFDTEVIFLENGETFADGDFSVRLHVFWISHKPIAAAEIEYKGESLVSLQDFDSFALEELQRGNYFFRCDYLKLPEALPANADSYENLSAGKILRDCRKFITKKE